MTQKNRKGPCSILGAVILELREKSVFVFLFYLLLSQFSLQECSKQKGRYLFVQHNSLQSPVIIYKIRSKLRANKSILVSACLSEIVDLQCLLLQQCDPVVVKQTLLCAPLLPRNQLSKKSPLLSAERTGVKIIQ